MFKLSTLTLPFLSAMLFFPVTANALDINSPQFKSQLQSDAKASLEAPQTAKIAMIEKTPESDLTSRTTVKKLDIFTVIDENGKRYRNHTP